MRTHLILLILSCLVGVGCTNGHPENEAPPAGGTGSPGSAAPAERTEIQTPEIVRILEEESIELTATTHSQYISITLNDGREYSGTYDHKQAGKYAGNEKLFDVLNLVSHIKDGRPPEEVEGWAILCE